MLKIIFLLFIYFLFSCSKSNIEKGNICLSIGDYISAISFYSEEVKKNPENYIARLGLGKAYLQKACNSDTGAWNLACMHLEAAKNLSPQNNEIKKLLNEVYLERARQLLAIKDTVSALQSLLYSIEYDNTALEPIILSGIIYYKIGETKKAEALFKKAISIDSLNVASLFNLGMIFFIDKRYEEAYEQLYKAIKISPDDKDIIYWFALAQKKLSESKK